MPVPVAFKDGSKLVLHGCLPAGVSSPPTIYPVELGCETTTYGRDRGTLPRSFVGLRLYARRGLVPGRVVRLDVLKQRKLITAGITCGREESTAIYGRGAVTPAPYYFPETTR